MSMKKALAFLLAVLMLLSALTLVACGGDGGKETADPSKGEETKDSGTTDSGDGTDSETTPSKYLDHLDEKYDFGGDTVNYLWRNKNDIMFILEPGAERDDTNLDVVSKAIFKRWCEIEERMGVYFDGQFFLNDGEVSSMLNNDVKGGTNDFDIVGGHMKFNASQATTGNLLNISKLPNVDLTQDYWNQDYVKKFTFKDYTFWVTGDITRGYLDNLVALFVYDPLWEERFGSIDNLFEIVESGQWTLAKAREITEDCYKDDGDTIRNSGDTFGWVVYSTGWVKSAVMLGAGYNFSLPTSGGKYKLDMTNDENEAIFTEFKKGFSTNPSMTESFTDKDDITLFKDGQTLMFHNTLDYMERFRDLTADYSVVPMPKAFEDQEYRTPSYDGVQIVGISASLRINKNRYEEVGTVLEAMAAAGKQYLTDAYFEVALRSKYAKNAGSYRCLSIIREKGYSDFAFCWCGALNEIDTFLANNWRVASLSAVASQQAQYEKLMTNLYSKLNALAKDDPD